MYTEKIFNPSDTQKIDGLEHVLYEIDMFTKLPSQTSNGLINNCITEAFLVHCRVLCDFFQKGRYQDDIISIDYGFSQSSLNIPEDIKTRFDKCLAHVTYSRTCLNDSTKEWLLDHFRPKLQDRIKEFLEHLISWGKLPLKQEDLNKAHAILKNIYKHIQ